MERSAGRREEVLAEARERYGHGAEFVRQNKDTKVYYGLTLDQAMQICEEHITSSSGLWDLLDDMYARAKALEGTPFMENIRANGREALKAYFDKR